MEVNNSRKSLLEITKGKICMYDIFGNCDKSNCTKQHLESIEQKNFLKTLINNSFDSSIVRKLPFYINDSKYINNSEQMNEYIKKKGIVDKADIRYEICNRFKKDLLKIGNKIGKFEEPKTHLSVCARNLFMPFCNNHKSGNFITIDVKYPDDTVTSIDLCYSSKQYLSLCNCDVEFFQSKKTKRYYLKDVFKITKSTGTNLGNYIKGENVDSNNSSYEREERKKVLPKEFNMEKAEFPSMVDKKLENIEPKKWCNKKLQSPSASPLTIDEELQDIVKKHETKESRLDSVSPLSFDFPSPREPQREISSSSLSEMSSPVKLEIKEFDKLIPKDLTKIDSRDEFIRIIDKLKIKYEQSRDIAIKYYEKYQNTLIVKDSNETNYKKTICDLKKNLEKQHLEQMSYLEEYSDLSESQMSDSSDHYLDDSLDEFF